MPKRAHAPGLPYRAGLRGVCDRKRRPARAPRPQLCGTIEPLPRAPAAIVHEINSVFGVYGISVDMRHLGLIADFMTHEGGYKALNRHGMFSEPSPLLKMTFETTMGFLTDAAVAGDVDRLSTPAASIVTGRHASPSRTRVLALSRLSLFSRSTPSPSLSPSRPCSRARPTAACALSSWSRTRHVARCSPPLCSRLTRAFRCPLQAAALRHWCLRALRAPAETRRCYGRVSTA